MGRRQKWLKGISSTASCPEKSVYAEGEIVEVYAELEYVGDEAEIKIAHATSPFYFPTKEKTRNFSIRYGIETACTHDGPELEVRSSQICSGHRLRLTIPGGPRPVGNDRFHFAFDTIGEFLAPTREDFDAVVFERIVGRRNDDAHVIAFGPGEVGDRRCRHDASAHDGRTFTYRTVRELTLDP